MKALVLVILTTLTSLSSFAGTTPSAQASADARLRLNVIAGRKALEDDVRQQIRAGFGEVRQLKIDWKALRCIAIPSRDEELSLGACVLSFSGWQTNGNLSISVGNTETKATLLFWDMD